ncbi:hypothetical protein Fmac_000889 [Flemingia macrophylla]|uniref:Uncharacterized protein n=1 Tax=Flemingia macrophylla TaxID=520843 RepID=A0ABD1NFK2_9FABA
MSCEAHQEALVACSIKSDLQINNHTDSKKQRSFSGLYWDFNNSNHYSPTLSSTRKATTGASSNHIQSKKTLDDSVPWEARLRNVSLSSCHSETPLSLNDRRFVSARSEMGTLTSCSFMPLNSEFRSNPVRRSFRERIHCHRLTRLRGASSFFSRAPASAQMGHASLFCFRQQRQRQGKRRRFAVRAKLSPTDTIGETVINHHHGHHDVAWKTLTEDDAHHRRRTTTMDTEDGRQILQA